MRAVFIKLPGKGIVSLDREFYLELARNNAYLQAKLKDRDGNEFKGVNLFIDYQGTVYELEWVYTFGNRRGMMLEFKNQDDVLKIAVDRTGIVGIGHGGKKMVKDAFRIETVIRLLYQPNYKRHSVIYYKTAGLEAIAEKMHVFLSHPSKEKYYFQKSI